MMPKPLNAETPENFDPGNKTIAEFMGHEPKKEYYVGADGSCVYDPASVDNYFPTWQLQKKEAERWLTENIRKYPKGWIARGNYTVQMRELYPYYHLYWDQIIPVCKKWQQLKVPKHFFHIHLILIEGTDALVTQYDIVRVWNQLIRNINCYNEHK